MTTSTETPTAPAAKLYRGRCIEELLPKIHADLGADAVVTRERWGLKGGVGGFFAQRFVELEACPAEEHRPQIDLVADDEEEVVFDPEPVAAFSAGPGAFDVARTTMEAVTFADLLRESTEPAPPPAPQPEPAPDAPAVEDALVASGMRPSLAREIAAEAAAHAGPFAAAGHGARAALVRRLAVKSGAPQGPIVLAGPALSGKTTCAAGLAAAYARSGARVTCVALRSEDRGTELQRLLAEAGVAVYSATDGAGARAWIAAQPEGSVVVVDTPGIAARAEGEIARLAEDLEAIGGEVHLTLPATFGLGSAAELVRALAPLRPECLAVTRLDETDCAGGAISLSLDAGLALSYVLEGGSVAPADPTELAAKVLP